MPPQKTIRQAAEERRAIQKSVEEAARPAPKAVARPAAPVVKPMSAAELTRRANAAAGSAPPVAPKPVVLSEADKALMAYAQKKSKK